MRHPFWIFNSILTSLVIAAFAFTFFFKQEVPERESIKPKKRAKDVTREVSKINISKIYEYDLFDTYRKEILTPKEPTLATPLPEPPQPSPMEVPAQPKPQFLDPLQITLHGIMATSDDSNNLAIILDNKTKREGVYKVGEKIEDAQLIRIFKNKVIFLRSNGQQEVFYLRAKDAQDDPTIAQISDWTNTVRKIAPNNYQIDPVAFVDRVSNLGKLIDLLDLTTSYKDGKGIGVRVGESDIDLFSQSLGLQAGDMIMDIAGIAVTSTKKRKEIYDHIISLREGDSFKVTLQRNGQLFTLNYTLKEFTESRKVEKTPPPGMVSEFGLTEEQQKILEKKHTFAPTLQEIRKQERRNMLQHGKPSDESATYPTIQE